MAFAKLIVSCYSDFTLIDVVGWEQETKCMFHYSEHYLKLKSRLLHYLVENSILTVEVELLDHWIVVVDATFMVSPFFGEVTVIVTLPVVVLPPEPTIEELSLQLRLMKEDKRSKNDPNTILEYVWLDMALTHKKIYKLIKKKIICMLFDCQANSII